MNRKGARRGMNTEHTEGTEKRNTRRFLCVLRVLRALCVHSPVSLCVLCGFAVSSVWPLELFWNDVGRGRMA